MTLGEIWKTSRSYLEPLGLQLNNRQWCLEISFIAFNYAFLVWLTLKKMPRMPVSGSPFWPAGGLAIACLLLWGRSRWLGIYLGMFFIHYILYSTPLHFALLYSFTPCFGSILIVTAILKLSGTNYPFYKVKDAAIFIFCIIFTGTIIQSVYQCYLYMWIGNRYSWAVFYDRFFSLWIGDSIGILFFAPFILTWGRAQWLEVTKKWWHWEVMLTIASLILISYLTLIQSQPLEYFFLLPLLWSAFRLGAQKTTLFVTITGFVASVLTGYQSGIFYKVAIDRHSILFLQLFVGVIAITTMLMLAIVHENREANLTLKKINLELEDRVFERTRELQTSEAKAIQLAQKAEAANNAKSAFIANMSHELRSPLNAVLGFSQLMIRANNIPPEHYENAGIIYRSGDYLLTLINNVLDLSKIEAGKIILDIHDFDLYRLLNELEEMLSLKAQNKDIGLYFNYDSSLPRYFSGDPVKLRQVLINLLNNAIKFTNEGHISLNIESRKISDSDQELWFTITDTGVGIDSTELPFLFEAFTQTKSGIDAQEGTGLGLAISKKFIQLMGGHIFVESEVNQGSIFRFHIRAKEGQGTTETISKNHRVVALAPHQPTYKILTVDDKPINCKLLIKLLLPLGFDVKTASHGQEAIAQWETWQPHLILMDMRMPIMDGYEATKYIKSTEKGKKTVIIALTASVLEEEKAVVLASGCDDFVRKPFTEKIIFETLTKHLGITYLYENIDPSEPSISLERSSTPRHKSLTSVEFEHVNRHWLFKLRTAALEADFNLVMKLLEDLPIEDTQIAQSLMQLTRQFEFDQIVNLITPLLSEKSEQ